jgi:hypothetical protein
VFTMAGIRSYFQYRKCSSDWPASRVRGLILSGRFLGERPGPWQIVAGAMVLAGGLVAVRGPAGPSEPDPQGGHHR